MVMRSVVEGWIIIAASTPSKAPSRAISSLPPKRSSAGRAQIAHPPGERAVQFGKRQRGAEAGGGDDVVAAGMADAGQGVVFGEDGDRRTAILSELRRIGGRQAECFFLRGEPVTLHGPDEVAGRLELLERQFGFAVDEVAEAEQLIAHGVDCAHHIASHLVLGHRLTALSHARIAVTRAEFAPKGGLPL